MFLNRSKWEGPFDALPLSQAEVAVGDLGQGLPPSALLISGYLLFVGAVLITGVLSCSIP